MRLRRASGGWAQLLPAIVAVAIVPVLAGGVAGGVKVAAEQRAAAQSLTATPLPEGPATTTTTIPAPPTTSPSTIAVSRTTTTTAAADLRPSIRIEAVPATPTAGETVRFVVTATQAGNCCSIHLTPGDGVAPAAPQSPNCTAAPGSPQRTEFTHVYNTPGTWTVTARSDAGRACDIEDATRAAFPGGRPAGTVPPIDTPAQPQRSASLQLVVKPGVTVSQGPKAPQIEASLLPTAGGVALDGAVFDLDGWVAKVTVEWGDGAPPVVLVPSRPCQNVASGWPAGIPLLMRDLPPGVTLGWVVPPPTHGYAAPGTYTVRVTALSTGCDGGSPQEVTRTLTASRP